MKRRRVLLLSVAAVLLMAAVACIALSACARNRSASPVALHGQLAVRDGRLIDERGESVRLRGVSTEGLQHFGEVVNPEAFDALAYDWGVDVVRLALYVGNAGYATRPQLKDVVKRGIELAIERGLYVIVDWHVLVPGDPRSSIYEGAPDFWREIAGEYGDRPNVIYEIMNEPNGPLDWSGDVKPYAQRMTDLIRSIDPDNLIVIGSTTWSQDVDRAAADPVEGVNLAYALHFYAGTHGEALRQKARAAIAAGALLFVSEWGTSEASGNGGPYFEEAEQWLRFLDENNISWVIWSLSNRDETSALLTALRVGTVPGEGQAVTQEMARLRPTTENSQGIPYWPEEHLSATGAWVRRIFRGE